MTVMAIAAAAGAWSARAVVPLPVAIGLVVVAVMTTRPGRAPVLLCATVGLLASVLGARAWNGLDVGAAFTRLGTYYQRATLVTDPQPVVGGVQVDVRVNGKRLRAIARPGSVAAALRDHLAG
jgi:hypothetical protein